MFITGIEIDKIIEGTHAKYGSKKNNAAKNSK